jgi:Na+/H+ antiporter NhaD/arsenite permease-like protein
VEHHVLNPNPWMIAPFGLLLAAIALAPLLFPKWWHHHFPKVAYALGAVTLAYYLFSLHAYERTLHTAAEYVSFIALIGSLYVVSGGIHINVKGEATSLVNVVFLLIGAVIANLLGTTGASMLLIRPWIRMNKYRITMHHIVFFIFIVSNVGGCLTPIGDPPLFLGYLKGVPFWWVLEKCWPMWAVGVGLLLVMFYAVDAFNFRRAPRAVREKETAHETWVFRGLGNLFFLALILAAVFVNDPPFLREALMVAAAVGSYFTTPKPVHEANDFNFFPVKEVAILFAGIFATMMPALDFLQHQCGELARTQPQLFTASLFYWGTGTLSSFLDNAPTYLSFLSAQMGAFVTPDLLREAAAQIAANGGDTAAVTGANAGLIRETIAALRAYYPGELAARAVTGDHLQVAVLLGHPEYARGLVAISVAAVFFGANTYIGNGPNFMVKAIADQNKVHTPTFLGYLLRFTLPFMLPVIAAVWWMFFRG